MKQRPSFQFYQQDFLGSMDVKTMTTEQVGCYCLLLFNCYNNAGTIPCDMGELTILCHGIAPGEKVLKKFYKDGEVLRNKRVDEELEKQTKFSKQQKEKAEKRWGKPKKKAIPKGCNGSAMVQGGECSSSSSSSSIKKTTKKSPTFKKLQKWFSGMKFVKNPEKYTDFYFSKYSEKVIKKALNNSNCLLKSDFDANCEHYKNL